MERRNKSTSTAPVSSSSLCPACHKPVDVLRAGHVAILDGAFRYFCDGVCKGAYVEATSRRPALDALTAEPPPVAPSPSSLALASALQDKQPVALSGVREQPKADASSHAASSHAASSTAPFFPPPASQRVDQDHDHEHDELASGIREHGDDDLDAYVHRRMDLVGGNFDIDDRSIETSSEVVDEEPSPSTLRSPSVTELENARARAGSEAGSLRANEKGADEKSEREAAEQLAARTRTTDDDNANAPALTLDDDETSSSNKSATTPLHVRLEQVLRVGKIVLAQIVAIAPIAGVFAGVLASVVSLAGEPAGVLRLPLALAAAAIVFARTGLSAREHSEPAPWVVVGPIAAASILATVAVIVHDPHADACASFVGLAAASALTVDILLARARRDVLAARARTVSALTVTARLLRSALPTTSDNGGENEVDASRVKPGEQVVVEAGETIPVDGIITTGDAEVAPWLDSPVLIEKTEGDAVVAGAVVVSGKLHINTTFSGAERAWLRMAHTASSRVDVAAPLVVLVRRMVERGAPAAGLLVAGAVYAGNGSWLDVALAACGGAYALSAVAGASAAALAHARGHVTAQRRGIVYKDAIAFDAAARADVAVVCSRGTILLGEPEIVAVEAITKDGVGKSSVSSANPNPTGTKTSTPDASTTGGDRTDPERGRGAAGSPREEMREERVLAIAAGAEMSSTHPFASAILREARARGVRPDNVRSALGHSGLGVTALAANGDRVIVGSRAFLLQEKVSVAIADTRTSQLEAEGRSVLLVAVGGRLVGLLALQDGLRPGARAAVQRLHDARIEPVLLSGEARDTCETIARALDIEHVRPEILPADRGAEVRALADGGRIVAALGHASTDDGALGAADVSIAMEAAGSAPGEWGVALASDDVRDAALSLTVPRASRDRARTAVIVGGLAQALGALGIAFGLAPPAVVPVLGVLTAAAVASIVRDPTLPDA